MEVFVLESRSGGNIVHNRWYPTLPLEATQE